MSESSAIIHSADQTRTDEMSDHDFHAFTNLIHKQTGIVITPAKRSMLVSRLSRRLRQLGLKDFSSYRSLLENEQESFELQKLVSVITTNVTIFVYLSVISSGFPYKLRLMMILHLTSNRTIMAQGIYFFKLHWTWFKINILG